MSDINSNRILIVEDEAILALALRESLEGMGYQVVGTADTAESAVLEFLRFMPDLVLMDIRLKGPTDGIAAARKIRSQSAVPIVFLTGNQDPATFESAKVEGAYGYVLKPYHPRELQLVVEIGLNKFREQQERSRLETTLINSEKLGTIGVLAAGIIHDMKGSLTVLSSLAERLSSISSDPNPSAADLGDMSKRLNRQVSTIVDTVNNYRKLIDATDSEPASTLDLQKVCRQAFELCEFLAVNKGVKFKELPSATCRGYCGQTSLIQVLVNLIRNSIDAVSGTTDPWIEITWSELDSKQVVLCVSDSGKGIAPEYREKLFKPLFTTKPVGQGTGLGLRLCRTLLANFGATLDYDESRSNTTFVIRLASNPASAVVSAANKG